MKTALYIITPTLCLFALILLHNYTDKKNKSKVIVAAKVHVLAPDNTLTHDIDEPEKYLLYCERINGTLSLFNKQITIQTDSTTYGRFQKGDTLPQLY